jgi:hypothetical protein
MHTYLIDFEFRAEPGRPPRPWCVVAECVETGEILHLWLDGSDTPCPFEIPYRLIAHYALAELSCILALGWQMPAEVIDTLPETRVVLGQAKPRCGLGLLSVASHFGIQTMTSEHKDSMRELAMGDFVPRERQDELTEYCAKDVFTLSAVWAKLVPEVNITQAAFRGRYLISLAAVEARGIPADADLVAALVAHRDEIKEASWHEARGKYPGAITEGGSFSSAGWLAWCESQGITWPVHGSGIAMLDEDTFKKMGDSHPEILIMHYARKLRSQSRGFQFPVGPDGRLRCMLSPFGSDTGRNQPSPNTYVFSASAWLRSIVQAPERKVLASVDYSSQEFALAAALATDDAMMADYRSGDPYLAFGQRAGGIPPGATKSSHTTERNIFKQVALAVQYGMGYESLAQRRGIPRSAARHLIAQHQASYPQYWKWRQKVIDTVTCGGSVSTAFGWKRHGRKKDSANSIGNFLVQSTGAEIMRLVIIALEEAGHRVIAPIHDGFVLEMDEDGHQEEFPRILEIFRQASLAVVPEIEVRTDSDLIMPGNHYVDGRGADMWRLVSPIIGRGVESSSW